MAKKFEEYIQVKLPSGAKEQLAKVASRKYDSVGGLARKLLMQELEREGVCVTPTETKAA
jgi:hypothetical protein